MIKKDIFEKIKNSNLSEEDKSCICALIKSYDRSDKKSIIQTIYCIFKKLDLSDLSDLISSFWEDD